MAAAFNLTAQLNLQGPTNLKPIVSKIKKELGSIKTTVDIDIKSTSIKNITAINSKLNALSKAAQNANGSVLTLNQSLSTLASGFTALNSANSASVTGVNNVVKSLSKTKSAVADTRNEIEEFGKQSGLAIRRFAAFSVVTGVVYSFTSALSSAFKEFASFNKEIVRLSQVTGKSVEQLKSVSDEITRLSTSLGVTSSDLITVSSTLAQAGLSAEDTRIALEALAKSSLAPSFEDIQSTTEGAIAAIRQFGLQANELEASLGSINSVAAAFAVESGDIITAIQRTGGVFAASSRGVTEGKDALNEFIAVFTSVRATTRESAESIATGLRTIFTRIQRGRTIDFLKQFGVDLTDLEGKFVGPYKAVEKLAEGLRGLDPRDLRFSQIIEELGGFRQIGKVIPLIQQFSTAEEALKVAQKGQGSLAKDAATAQQSLAVQFTKTREAFLALVRDIGDSKSFQAFVGITLNLANSLITLAGALKPLLPMLLTLAAIKVGAGLTEYISGFAKGFSGRGGKGGGGGPSPIPGGPSGPSGGPASGNNNNTALIGNTSALTNLATVIHTLSNQVGVLTNAVIESNVLLKTRLGTKGFATGGLVPGSGNRDTVSAKLTPGEFVIRKNAVNAIGVDRLQKINKYGKGGLVEPSTSNVGFAILSSKLKGARTSISAEDIVSSTPPAYQDQIKNILQTERQNHGYTLIREGLSASLKKKFDKAINSGLRSGVNATLKSLSKKGSPFDTLPVPTITKDNVDNFLSGINPGARASFFEEILTSMKNQGKYSDSNDPNRPFDFPQGLGVASDSDNPVFPALKGVRYVDAKSSTSAAKPIGKNGAMSSKIASQLLLEEAGIISGAKKVKNLDTLSADIIRKLAGKRGEGKLDSLSFRAANITATIPQLMELAAQPNSPIELVKAPSKSGKGAIFKMRGAKPFASGGKVQKFNKGGLSKRVGIFDFDETTAITKQRETPSLSGFKNPALAVPDIESGQATRMIELMKQYGTSGILTARSGGPQGEMRVALKKFFKQNGIYLPDSRLVTTGDQISGLPTAERKARVLFEMVKKYGKNIDFWDDNVDNVTAGSMVKGVTSRLVDKSKLLKRNSGGATPGSGEDSVHALLTPGEFVINKQAASKLGPSRLHALNKADKLPKFAKGGFVGPQKFAKGGGVSGAAMGMMVFSGLQYQIDQLTSGFSGLDTAVGKSIKEFINSATTLAVSTKVATDLLGGKKNQKFGNQLTAVSAGIGGISGALSGYGSKTLEINLQRNTDALSAFKKTLESIGSAPTESMRLESIDRLDSSFNRLTKVFDENMEKIKIGDTVNKFGKGLSNVTSTFVTTATTFMLISQQLKMAKVAKQLSEAGKGASIASKGLGALGMAVGLFTKFSGYLAIAITAVSALTEVWSLWTDSVSSSKEQLLAHADALKEVVANTREYSIANKGYTEGILSLASKVLSMDRNTQIRAFGELQPTSNIPGVNNKDSVGLNSLNLNLQRYIQAQLNQARPGLGNVSVADFASLSKENAALVARIIQESLPQFIEQQFTQVEQNRPDLIKRTGLIGTTTFDDKRRAVEAYIGEESIKKFSADKLKLASKEIQVQVATLTNIFSQLAANIKATSTSISNSIADLNTVVDIRMGEAKVEANPAFERASKTLSNLVGSSQADFDSALRVIDRLLNNQTQGPENDRLREAITSIQSLKRLETELPTILERVQQTTGFGPDSKLDDVLRSYFKGIVPDSSLNDLVDQTIALLETNSRQGESILTKDQLAAASQDVAKSLEAANIPLSKFIEIADQAASTAKELATAQQRLIDTMNRQDKFLSDVQQNRIEQEMDVRRALGQEVDPIEMNKVFATQIRGILGQSKDSPDKSVDDLITQLETATKRLEDRGGMKRTDPDFLKIDMYRNNEQRELVRTINNTTQALEKYAHSIELSKNITDQLNKENAKGIKNRDALFKIFMDSKEPGGLQKYAILAKQLQQLNLATATNMPDALGVNASQQELTVNDLLRNLQENSFLFDDQEMNKILDKILDAFALIEPAVKDRVNALRRRPEMDALKAQQDTVKKDADKATEALSDRMKSAVDLQIKEIERLSLQFQSFETTLGEVNNRILTTINNLDKQLAPTTSAQTDAKTVAMLRDQFSRNYGDILNIGNNQNISSITDLNLFDKLFGGVDYTTKEKSRQPLADLTRELRSIEEKASRASTKEEFTKIEIEFERSIIKFREFVNTLSSYQQFLLQQSMTDTTRKSTNTLFGRKLYNNDSDATDPIKALQLRRESDKKTNNPDKQPSYEYQQKPKSTDSSLNMKQFDFFGKTLDTFKIAFGLNVKKFDTTIKALAAVFPTLNTPIVKFEQSVNKLIAKLDAIDAAGGIKGPNIPEKVKVEVAFNDSINVVADGNNNDNLLQEIQRITHNTVVQELKKMNTFGHNTTYYT